MDYKKKYEKYKYKYLKAKYQYGGKKLDYHIDVDKYILDKELLKILKNKNIKAMPKKLTEFINKITTQNYCDDTYGSGLFGKVIAHRIADKIDVKMGNKIVQLPIVIKTLNIDNTRFEPEYKFSHVYNKKNLIFWSMRDFTGEALILILVSGLWYNNITPHVPVLWGVDSCMHKGYDIIDNMVLLKEGLKEQVEITEDKIIYPYLMAKNYKYIPKQYTRLTTLGDLLTYISNTYDNGHVKLPNNKSANVTQLIDELYISFIHTAYLLYKKYKILLNDQHSNNIFLHWLDDDSYYGKKNIKNTKHIYYQIGKNKYVKIETHGLMLKLGDLGTCLMNPAKNVYLISSTFPDSDVTSAPNVKFDYPTYIEMKWNFIGFLPNGMYSDTIINKMEEIYPYNMSVRGIPSKLYKKFPSFLEILNHKMFSKYHTNKISKKDSIIIKM